MQTWTYDGYWAVVIGGHRDASDVVNEFELIGGPPHDIDEWLGTAEEAARVEGELDATPEEWSGFYRRALEELKTAIAQA